MRDGVALIGSGAVRTRADLDGLPALRPARALLDHVVGAVARAVDRESRGLILTRQQVHDEQAQARAALAKAQAEIEAIKRAKLAPETERKEVAALKEESVARARDANKLLRCARLLVEACDPLMAQLPEVVAEAVRSLAAAREGWASFKGPEGRDR